MAELFSRIGVTDFGTVSIGITDLTMSRGNVALFSGLSVHVTNKDILWIQGDNGIGKTTLLGALAGLHNFDAGSISWMADSKSCEAGHIIAYQPHQSYAKAALTTQEDLMFWAKLHQSHYPIDVALHDVGLQSKIDVRTGKLSAGQKRRLSLAKLLISEKPIWVMDEPAAAMDSDGVALIDRLIEAHTKRGGVAIIASHGAARSLSQATRILTLKAMT